MYSGCDYITVDSKERFESRSVVRVPAHKSLSQRAEGNRTFVPFAGFTGQQLAGTGALVFEGELLQERKH